jgi:spore maturation protein CgeB
MRNTAGSRVIFAPTLAKWWGSDARALAQAFRRLGHYILDIDEEDYVPWRWEGFLPRASRRLLSPFWIKNYNDAVLRKADSAYYDFILVFKGTFLKPETVKALTVRGKPIYNFYPDTNFLDYGANIQKSLALYDCVFSTKSFHGPSEMRQFGIKDLQHVRHGFDPEVHRPIAISQEMEKNYGCDVSFVGCWSPAHESTLLYLLRSSPDIHLRVFGLGWKYSSDEFKSRLGDNLREGAFGDELAMIYCASKINLGLLRRAQTDATIQDQSTARSFQVPATGSFMLHEDTAEIRTYFEPDEEVMLFASNEEMIQKIRLVLASPMLRKTISERGYGRCHSEPYDYSSAAQAIVSRFEGKRSAGSVPGHENESTNQLEAHLTY